MNPPRHRLVTTHPRCDAGVEPLGPALLDFEMRQKMLAKLIARGDFPNTPASAYPPGRSATTAGLGREITCAAINFPSSPTPSRPAAIAASTAAMSPSMMTVI